MTILVTGAAGFIGFHLANRLAREGHRVVALDNLNDYYAVSLKKARLAQLEGPCIETIDVADLPALEALFARERFTRVVHLAAQAGVRHSVTHPHEYGRSNMIGFLNVLDVCTRFNVEHLLYASSSSVYGRQETLPFRESDPVDRPASLYAASKRANEMMAYSYADLHRLPATGLRFFTVYGPWGRPDMAPSLFAERLMRGEPIDIFNHGQMARDFTFVDDIVESIVRLIPKAPGAAGETPHAIYNVGRGEPVSLLSFVELLERALGVTAHKRFKPMQPGDVERTWADTSALQAVTGYRPQVSLEVGIERFVDWIKRYHGAGSGAVRVPRRPRVAGPVMRDLHSVRV
ncbi:SDR family NAD(P)-dependent oxidoreductase [Larsenimonas suaedae]|uniref:SDR family NAD(P)-dependent oxidoreductase n=1 Tax=Larsenimonas suaedae TaxID=1851019 RepID=A0ABU1GW28_9GAMM|nr:SDR family NAD(P)-dependent oxidoreductase [Larsenimonas suaedae]MCM2973362.1 SDR family NAD(P)-dependent oxidoreductase [Larsenimonas suaedae]MDR5896255.1 SDR family NAD(P)-dependent oxidoreductase [Larsenimonas suaedae]